MEIGRSGCCSVQVALKTEEEIRAPLGWYEVYSNIEVSYYKINIVGKIAAFCGLAFKAVDQHSNTVYYLSKKDMTRNLARQFGISNVNKNVLHQVFAVAFTLVEGHYVFNPAFRGNLTDLVQTLSQEEEQKKAAQVTTSRIDQFDPITGALNRETRGCWKRLLSSCRRRSRAGVTHLTKPSVLERSEENEKYFG